MGNLTGSRIYLRIRAFVPARRLCGSPIVDARCTRRTPRLISPHVALSIRSFLSGVHLLYAFLRLWRPLVAVTVGLSANLAWSQARPHGVFALRIVATAKWPWISQWSQRTGHLPDVLKDTFDLEMCDSLRLSVAGAYNAAEADKRLDEAEVHLERFLKEHPNHEAVSKALESAADIAFDRGVQQLRVSPVYKRQRAAGEVLSRSSQSLDRLASALCASIGKNPGQAAGDEGGSRRGQIGREARQRQGQSQGQAASSAKAKADEEAARRLPNGWSRFKVAMVDYHTAQTYTDPADKARKAAAGKRNQNL